MSAKQLIPYCRSAIWGGSTFKEVFESSLENIAEAWVWSVREGEDSMLVDGTPIRNHLKEQGFLENLENPLLIKLLDAKDILSVQVHPNDEAAFALEGLSCGKTEMWYILSSDEGAYLYAGLSQGKAPFEAALSRGEDPTPYLKKVFVKKGDIIYIPAGMVHAIGAGVRLLEMQQNSDTTYRVWDFLRKDKNGNFRELHTEKALAAAKDIKEEEIRAFRFEKGTDASFCQRAENADISLLANGRYFAAEKISLQDGNATVFAKTPICAVITDGTLCIDGTAYPIYTPLLLEGETHVKGTGELVLCGNGEMLCKE